SLHRSAVHSSPGSHSPVNVSPFALSIAVPVSDVLYGSPTSPVGSLGSCSPANDGFSGQIPVSMTPTTTPCPASGAPPSSCHTPSAPDSPRNSGELTVSTWRGV